MRKRVQRIDQIAAEVYRLIDDRNSPLRVLPEGDSGKRQLSGWTLDVHHQGFEGTGKISRRFVTRKDWNDAPRTRQIPLKHKRASKTNPVVSGIVQQHNSRRNRDATEFSFGCELPRTGYKEQQYETEQRKRTQPAKILSERFGIQRHQLTKFGIRFKR